MLALRSASVPVKSHVSRLQPQDLQADPLLGGKSFPPTPETGNLPALAILTEHLKASWSSEQLDDKVPM
jgi:hypothetical protein